jgi:hypothetical protein
MINELEFNGLLKKGDSGVRVKVIQEWLCLRGFNVVIDGGFGSATEKAVYNFQLDTKKNPNKIVSNGIVDALTYQYLVQPMLDVLQPSTIPLLKSRSLGEMMRYFAMSHLASHPREVGGLNKGPWVRLYMDGKEGTVWPWCAGFVSFVLKQACSSLSKTIPFQTSFSCDMMAKNAMDKKMFHPGAEIGKMRGENLNGAIFFVRKTTGDWTHTGIVIEAKYDVFSTIEGNTNDAGDREGYEVCRRFRNYENKDFILL